MKYAVYMKSLGIILTSVSILNMSISVLLQELQLDRDCSQILPIS